jgi:mannan endo-1,4-beta-mannosidase
MKNLITIASLAGAACAVPIISRPDAREASSPIARRQTPTFPSTSGTSFVIDGKQQYFAGTNTYWIGFQTNDADVDLVMKNIASSGMKVLRVWGFNDVTSATDQVYYQSFIDGEAKINTGANGLERLDYVVKSAEENGVKLIINFVNNWTDYGGMAAYVQCTVVHERKSPDSVPSLHQSRGQPPQLLASHLRLGAGQRAALQRL